MGFGSMALRVCFILTMALERKCSIEKSTSGLLKTAGDFQEATTSTLDLMLMKMVSYI